MDALIFKTRKAAESYAESVEGWYPVKHGNTDVMRLPGKRRWVVCCYTKDNVWSAMGIEGRVYYYTSEQLYQLGA